MEVVEDKSLFFFPCKYNDESPNSDTLELCKTEKEDYIQMTNQIKDSTSEKEEVKSGFAFVLHIQLS